MMWLTLGFISACSLLILNAALSYGDRIFNRVQTVFQSLMKTIAIIGAGLSGLIAAHELSNHSRVTIFEKSRGLGGRMSTRRADPYAFDHGAQYFTVKSVAFEKFLQPYMSRGVVVDWQPQMVNLSITNKKDKLSSYPSYVASPGMSALCKAIASDMPKGIRIETECHIDAIQGESKAWTLLDKEDGTHGPFDLVISAIPCHQAAALLPKSFAHHQLVLNAKMDACFTVMLGFSEPVSLGFDGAFVEDDMIGWIAVNSSKPERAASNSVIIQSRNDWAEQFVNNDKQQVLERLLERASQLTDQDLTIAEHQGLHRWLYASTSKSASQVSLVDLNNGLAAIGDWCVRGRVEGAFESAVSLVSQIKKSFNSTQVE